MQDKIILLSSRQAVEPGQAFKSHLPLQLNPLLGREPEVQAACALLRRPEVRLLTLIGTGGIGKTRLGIQVATNLGEDFTDGVSFVPLAPISNPDLVIPTIAAALELKEAGEQPLLEHLKAFLRDKHLLLLLDNFEQVVLAAPTLSALLTDCPQLKILVTSRAALHIQGEYEFPVPPLAVPDLKRLPNLDMLPHYAALALFIQRALAMKPDFQLTKANAGAIAEICVRLDGLPLAIELAAARIKLLPPQALLARLEHRLQILTSGAQDVPARQQTLRNTIAWSYGLLSAAEQQLFQRLSVFVGGCTLQTAESVCGAPCDAVSVFDGVASLVDKSLLQQIEREGDEPRLMMLETIREYGLEALIASGEMESTCQAHASYYLALAEKAKPELSGPRQAVWLERLEREHDNLRAAMGWSLEQKDTGQKIEMALLFSRALAGFWKTRGHYSEGRTFLKRVLAGSKESMTATRAEALNSAADLAHAQGDYSESEGLSSESLALSRRLEDTRNIAASLCLLAGSAVVKDDPITAEKLWEEALALYRELGDKQRVANTLFGLGWQAKSQDEYTRARALLEESLVMQRSLGDVGGIAHTLFQLAEVLFRVQGDSTTLRSLLEESHALFKEVGDKEGTAYVLDLSGEIALKQGDINAARSLYEAALALYREIGDLPAMTWMLYGLAFGAIALGEFKWAAQLWGAAEVMLEAKGASIPTAERANYERSTTALRNSLGEKAFAAAWAEGRAMSPEQALATLELIPIPREYPMRPAQTPPAKTLTNLAGLTERELEVLRLVAQGLTNAQIAEQLIVSPHTVHAHVRSIHSKLGVTSRSAVTRYAFENGLA